MILHFQKQIIWKKENLLPNDHSLYFQLKNCLILFVKHYFSNLK